MPEPEPVDEESMLAEAASGELGDLAGRRDPEEAALELLAAELGAKPLDAR
jgi:DNA polymerase-3 subunit gamma/tau